MESKIREIFRENSFVRDIHGGLVDMTEVIRVTIRKQKLSEPSPRSQYGVAVKQRGDDEWVIMKTGTYETCKVLLDNISDALTAHNSLSEVFNPEPEPEPEPEEKSGDDEAVQELLLDE